MMLKFELILLPNFTGVIAESYTSLDYRECHLGEIEGNLPIAVSGDSLSRAPCGFKVYNCPRCHY